MSDSGFLGDALNKAKDAVSDFAEENKDKIEDAANQAVDKAKEMAGDHANVVDDVVNKAKDAFGGNKE